MEGMMGVTEVAGDSDAAGPGGVANSTFNVDLW